MSFSWSFCPACGFADAAVNTPPVLGAARLARKNGIKIESKVAVCCVETRSGLVLGPDLDRLFLELL